jgi:hypothetical protein
VIGKKEWAMTTRRQFMISVPAVAAAFALADNFVFEASPDLHETIDTAG